MSKQKPMGAKLEAPMVVTPERGVGPARYFRCLVKRGNTYEVLRVLASVESAEVEFAKDLAGINLGKMERMATLEAGKEEG